MNYIKTSLYEEHDKLGAKIIPFAGYLMPVSYNNGLIAEYNAVRLNVGMFDVSHMGQLLIEGSNAEQFLNYVTVNNVNKIQAGGAQYSAFCNKDGKVIDDIIVYKNNSESFFIVVNASNIDKDYNWLLQNNTYNVKIDNLSSDYSILAVQGPESRKLLMKCLGIDLSNIKFYTFQSFKIFDQDVIVSRTGYTGELGYEIIANDIMKIWKVLLKHDVMPCGLAVRDILRIEMKYCLYGNDLSDQINPIQAGLKWIVDFTKKDFIGKEHFQKEIDKASTRLICFKMLEKAIPRKDYSVYLDNKKIGIVSSGTFSMGLNSGIGLAFVDARYINEKNINIKIRNKFYQSQIVKPPFIKKYSLHS